MFGIGWLELLLITIVTLIFVGPKELPFVLGKLGRTLRHIKAFIYRMNQSLDEFLSDAEAAELKKKSIENHDKEQ